MNLNYTFDYSKLFLKEVLILLPRYHPNLTSFLTPILGLYGINVKNFLNDLEPLLVHINYDITIPIVVKISKIKTYEIIIKAPTVSELCINFSFSNNEYNNLDAFSIIDPLVVYKCAFIKSLDTRSKTLSQSLIFNNYKKIYGYFLSLNKNLKKRFLNGLEVYLKNKSYFGPGFNLNLSNNMRSFLFNLKKSFLFFDKFQLLKKSNFGFIIQYFSINNHSLLDLHNFFKSFGLTLRKLPNYFWDCQSTDIKTFSNSIIITSSKFSQVYAVLKSKLNIESKFRFIQHYFLYKKMVIDLNFFKTELYLLFNNLINQSTSKQKQSLIPFFFNVFNSNFFHFLLKIFNRSFFSLYMCVNINKNVSNISSTY